MSRETGSLNTDMQSWLHEHSLRETDVQRALRHDMGSHPEGGMQTSPEQAQFMALLFESIGGKRAIEVGVFTGYSALAIAHVLPPDGELVACDISAAGLAETIDAAKELPGSVYGLEVDVTQEEQVQGLSLTQRRPWAG